MSDHKPDLAAFADMNQRNRRWDSKRVSLIKEQFPATAHLDWKRAFDQDMDLFARLLRDILKLDQAQPGRPGPRPALDYETGVQRLRQYMGEDYSVLPFGEAFKILSAGRSIRNLAAKTGLDRNQVHRLLTGQIDPDVYSMTQVAKSFNKHASYFLEYRTLVITNAILGRLEYSPETTIGMYRKLQESVDGSS